MDADHASDHFRDHDHVAEMGPDGIWLLPWGSILLSFPELLDESQRLTLKAPCESSSCSRMEELHELFTR